ncbi:MAG: PAS domain S-box protein [Thermoplasmata archaeon]|nr:PAS domain S-box protein [Thermoplasmata archaeon]
MHSEKKTLEEKRSIPSREDLTRTLLEDFQEGLAIIGTDFTILEVNRWLRDFYGKISGEKCYEVFLGRDSSCPDCPVKGIENSPKYFCRKGIWLEICAYPIKNCMGKIVGILEQLRDVTKMKPEEDEIKSLLNSVFDDIDVGFFILDENFRVVWMNNTLQEYFGIERKEVIGKDKRDLIQKKIKYIFEKPDRFAHKVLSSYDDNAYTMSFECHVLPDEKREERWLEHRSKPISFGPYKGGRIELYYDVTERKILETKLMENLKIFKTLAEEAKDGIIMIDNDGKVVFWNKGAEEIFGYKADEIIGKDMHITCASRECLDDYMKGFIVFRRHGRGKVVGRTVEVTGIRKDGRRIPVELSVSAVKIRGKWHAIGIARDISKRKRMEEELKKKVEELERFYRIALDRELKMIELKKKINQLLRERGKEQRYIIEGG